MYAAQHLRRVKNSNQSTFSTDALSQREEIWVKRGSFKPTEVTVEVAEIPKPVLALHGENSSTHILRLIAYCL
jgi:hypothetical protein